MYRWFKTELVDKAKWLTHPPDLIYHKQSEMCVKKRIASLEHQKRLNEMLR